MTPNTRGQSETIGVVLLTGVIVVVAVVAGFVMVTNVSSQTTSAPLLDIDANATTQNITIEHTGGNDLNAADVDIILRGDSTVRYSLESFTEVTGSDGTRFTPGNKWQRTHGISGERMEVLVVHTPSNAIVARDTVPITVTIAARFSYTPNNPTSTDTVTFDASDSTVKGSTLNSYEWDFSNNGTTDKTGETVEYNFSDDEDYPVTLTVTADDGRIANRTKTVTVYNRIPTASFTYTPSNPDPGENISFDASGSSDPDGDIASYEWEFDDGNTSNGETTNHSYASAGDYIVQLDVTDNDGATRRTSQVVSVGGQSPPSVTITSTSISETGSSGKYTVDVTFEASDPDGDITNYTAYLYNSSSQTTELDNVSLANYDGSTTTETLNDNNNTAGESPLYVLVKVGDSTNRTGNDSDIVGGSAGQALEFQELTTGTEGELNFTVKNNNSESVTVTEFAVDASNIKKDSQIDNEGGSEVKIDSADSADSGPYAADGTKHILDVEARINTDQTTSVLIKRIEKKQNGKALKFDLKRVNTKSNSDLVVTLGLKNTTDQKFYFKNQ
ncbi:PKD domain-containing protein [Salinibaculum rarum]|uniref:PKD domain-containing protein n=1 Tax=Salinibaculum rarum TaxID=3058903 RepID=UPI00265DC231|nr:PKD domain-containing protein [Salinibaculum sp. KK48]